MPRNLQEQGQLRQDDDMVLEVRHSPLARQERRPHDAGHSSTQALTGDAMSYKITQKKNMKWVVSIRIWGATSIIGTYDTLNQATLAAKEHHMCILNIREKD